MRKKCSGCEKVFGQEGFHKDKSSSDGYRSICKECAKAKSKAWYEKSDTYRLIIRNSGLRKRFGIDQADYFEMLKTQGGVCAICKKPPEEGKYLHVDHDHNTGDIRGLLCKPCNHGLGNFKDDVDTLTNAIEYLDRNSVSNF